MAAEAFDAQVASLAARLHVTWAEATAYLRGRAAHGRGARLLLANPSCVDAWYAAGWHDADIESGASVLAQRLEALS